MTKMAAATTPVRAGIYVRISEARNGDELGVKRQDRECRKLARDRGWPVVNVYTDNDISAYRGKHRPAYEALLADVAAGKLDAVIAWHADRLYRHPRDLEAFVQTVEAAKAKVATVQAGELDLSTPSGRMVARMLGAASRFEVEQKGARQAAKAAELAAAGKVGGGGTRPFGFAADRMTVVLPEAALIREAAAHIIAGGSLRSLGHEWAARHVVTPTGGTWLPSTIKRMLISPRIAGLREHRGVVVGPAGWDAIITPVEHEKLVSILTDPARNRRTDPTERKYLLTGGLAVCGRCGAPLVARPNARHRRYVCSVDHGGCNKTFMRADWLEDHVASLVLDALAGPGLDAILAEESAVTESGDADELAATERRLVELADAYAEGTIGLDAYKRGTSKLEAKIVDLRERARSASRSRTVRQLPSGDAELGTWWETATMRERNEVCMLVLEGVVVHPGRAGLNRFDPERVDPRWRA